MKLATLCLLTVGFLFAMGCGDDPPTGDTPGVDPPGRLDGVVTFTNSWSGEWSVTATFRDCTSGDIIVVEDLLGMLCAGDSLATGISGLFTRCEGEITNERLGVTCEYTFDTGDCFVRASLSMAIELDGDAITGTAVWSAQTSTDCGDAYPLGCEEVEISGVRIGPPQCGTGTTRLPTMLMARPRARLGS